MSLASFFSDLKQKTSELKNEVLKYKNKTFLEAAIAGAVVIMLADRKAESSEKQKALNFVKSNEALSVFEQSEVIKVFGDFTSSFDFDFDIGMAKALEAIRKINGNDAQARLVMRLSVAIGGADGNFDDSERKAAILVAKELGLDPADFGI